MNYGGRHTRTRLHVLISWKHFRGWRFHCFDLCRLLTKKGEAICLFSLWGNETHLNKEVICTNLNLKDQFRVQLSYWKLIFGHWRSTGHVLVAALCVVHHLQLDSTLWCLDCYQTLSRAAGEARACTGVGLSQIKPNPFFLYSGSIYCPKRGTSHSILMFHECDWWISLSHIWVWFTGFVHASSWRKLQWTHLGLPSCCQNIWIQYFFRLLCIDCLFCPLCLMLWKSAGVSLNA